MIEKLKQTVRGFDDKPAMPTAIEFFNKINELVDAINELQKQIDKVSCAILDLATPDGENKALESIKAEPEYKNRNVKQAEKWMNCLCRFWNDGCDSYYGELVNIDTKVSSDAPFERDTGDWYQCCEPVKPDDDIIYKGGDND